MECRNLEKAEDAKTKILKEISEAFLAIIQLGLSDLSSMRSFANTYRNSCNTLNMLCNNAGIMVIPKRIETVDGSDLQLGTNHFRHSALTRLLLDLIGKVNGRIVTMISSGHTLKHGLCRTCNGRIFI